MSSYALSPLGDVSLILLMLPHVSRRLYKDIKQLHWEQMGKNKLSIRVKFRPKNVHATLQMFVGVPA